MAIGYRKPLASVMGENEFGHEGRPCRQGITQQTTIHSLIEPLRNIGEIGLHIIVAVGTKA